MAHLSDTNNIQVRMHGGLPAASSFPFESFSYKLRTGSTSTVIDPQKVSMAQQYNLTLTGHPDLRHWLRQHVMDQHQAPGEHDTYVSSGTNHALEVVTALMMERGDPILCEEFSYFYMLDSVITAAGYKVLPVAMDQHGMKPEHLNQILQRRSELGMSIPRLLYTVPVGQNPTGTTVPLERRRDLYKVAQDWNLIIIEDDAYYYLQYPNGADKLPGTHALGASYLSMDTDGRVVRMDSCSKLLAPGLRLGWVTAAPPLLEKMAMHTHASLNGPNGICQALLMELLSQWGESGFEKYVLTMQAEYQRRAAVLQAAVEKELTGLVEWRKPTAGMFMWLKLLAGVRDADEVLPELAEAGVMVLPGRIAHCQGPRTPFPCPYIRLSFASASDEDMQLAASRLADILRSHQQRQHDLLKPQPALAA
ncbi:hypothetical protein WJX74_000131 [Apatococcus lobatus]|uniref:Aminotransferase class I/classII large domain-containing protein n=1 Tax=Apatococcus lobatus TaxID=904363 RepID=A0AAW1RNS8_9CHLO